MKGTTVQVGDRVIFERFDRDPIITQVESLTPSGWVKIPEEKKAFRPQSYGWRAGDFVQGDNYRLFVYSDERFQERKERSAEIAREEARKKTERENYKRERAETLAAQHATIRRICDNTLPVIFTTTLPGGDRLYVVNVPLSPKRLALQYDTITVRIADEEEVNWDASPIQKEMKKAAYGHCFTGLRGLSGGATFSRAVYDSDEEALWDFTRDRYFD